MVLTYVTIFGLSFCASINTGVVHRICKDNGCFHGDLERECPIMLSACIDHDRPGSTYTAPLSHVESGSVDDPCIVVCCVDLSWGLFNLNERTNQLLPDTAASGRSFDSPVFRSGWDFPRFQLPHNFLSISIYLYFIEKSLMQPWTPLDKICTKWYYI